MTAGEIAARFDCSWPTTSRHLRQLELSGLIQAESRGRARIYTLDNAYLQSVVGGWLSRLAK